jgi:hypothetical protein
MRLLQTHDLHFREFADNEIPKYAILSHTWGPSVEEVTFQELQNPNQYVRRKAGYEKILRCAEKASLLGYMYVWIDTCCIDKRSSAELSEAINSMYAWYKNSDICFAHLADVERHSFVSRRQTTPNNLRSCVNLETNNKEKFKRSNQ